MNSAGMTAEFAVWFHSPRFYDRKGGCEGRGSSDTSSGAGATASTKAGVRHVLWPSFLLLLLLSPASGPSAGCVATLVSDGQPSSSSLGRRRPQKAVGWWRCSGAAAAPLLHCCSAAAGAGQAKR